jgi:hypothetical protein
MFFKNAFRCSGTKLTFKVMFHVAERATPVADCPDGMCDLELIEKKFKSTLDQCM